MAPYADRNARGAAVPDEHLLPTIKTVTWWPSRELPDWLKTFLTITAAGCLALGFLAGLVWLRRVGVL